MLRWEDYLNVEEKKKKEGDETINQFAPPYATERVEFPCHWQSQKEFLYSKLNSLENSISIREHSSSIKTHFESIKINRSIHIFFMLPYFRFMFITSFDFSSLGLTDNFSAIKCLKHSLEYSFLFIKFTSIQSILCHECEWNECNLIKWNER